MSTSEKEYLCDSGSCSEDVFNYMRKKANFVYSFSGLQIIGLAFDGHAIYGPYNGDEELWTCEDHDVCNGRFFPEMDNSYAYVATSTHPYLVGCWGPAPMQTHPQACSKNTCATGGSTYHNLFSILGVQMLVITVFLTIS